MATFAQLWANHPNIKGDTPLLDKAVYENQCAINVSAALMRSGVDMSRYPGVKSWQKDKPKYAIRARELAAWLASGGAHLPIKTEKLSGKEAFGEVKGRKGIEDRNGIVYFENYWGENNQGDHIDLWNGSRLTHWRSWLQIHARIGSVGIGSDYRVAQQVWFWQLS